ncbi:uncharacterized protein LOC105629694 isoform X2 [Jatropha curcas]|uniref:uncharacterized protein LOC105629694 isoform X2 n=1 Tax=Jatropha curcas TaxID=180498 RepID=UPI0009D6FB5E|nr:uncharacterized protein LOC105629694 isoform X2 [Jatropha curcas]
MDGKKIPFKVGQIAEARTFDPGFRGAWFRCKIKEVSWKKRDVRYALEYFDFPDEKVEWTHLYRKTGKSKGAKLVLRPSFPPVYRESQLPDITASSDVVVIVNDAWKVGDLVDWWSDDCYWSGRISEKIGNEKFRIKLFPPPAGEGLSYDASCKDLRPSLDWTPEHGWTVPKPMVPHLNHCSFHGSEDCNPCARLVKPVNQAFKNLTANSVDEGEKDLNTALSSHTSASHLQPPDVSEQEAKDPAVYMETQTLEIKDLRNSGSGKTSCSDSVSTLQIGDASTEVAGDIEGKNSHYDSGPPKKMKTDGSISLNSMCSDTIDAKLLDLEELVNRVKWIKDIFEFGLPLPNSVRPSWKFVEHRASSLPK